MIGTNSNSFGNRPNQNRSSSYVSSMSSSQLQPSQQYRLSNKSKEDFYKYANVESKSSLEIPEPLYISTSRDQQSTEYDPHTGFDDSHSLISDASMSDDARYYKRSSRIFLITSLISALVILGLEVYMYAAINIHKEKMERPEKYIELSIFLSFFIFAAIYQVLVTIIAIKTKNMLLMAMLCAFYSCMLIYTGIQYEEVLRFVGSKLSEGWKKATKATNIAAILVIAITLMIQVYMIFFVLRKNVQWFRYKIIGADVRIKRMYSMFQIHRSLLIFDFFFFLGFTVQFIVIMINDKTSVEFILTVCVLPLTLIILWLSDFAATREIQILTLVSLILYLGGCAYVLFKIIRLFTKYSSAFHIAVSSRGSYFPGRNSLVTFGIITLVFLLATIVVEIIVLRNYDRGLRPIVSKSYRGLPGTRFDDGCSVRLNDLTISETNSHIDGPSTFLYRESKANESLLID